MDEPVLARLDRKIDTLLERTKNVEADHEEIGKLRERMHRVEGAQAVFRNLLDEFRRLNDTVSSMDERLETVESDQITAKAIQDALNKHEEHLSQRSERRERRIFAVLGLLSSLGLLNFVMNVVQNSP